MSADRRIKHMAQPRSGESLKLHYSFDGEKELFHVWCFELVFAAALTFSLRGVVKELNVIYCILVYLNRFLNYY